MKIEDHLVTITTAYEAIVEGLSIRVNHIVADAMELRAATSIQVRCNLVRLLTKHEVTIPKQQNRSIQEREAKRYLRRVADQGK